MVVNGHCTHVLDRITYKNMGGSFQDHSLAGALTLERPREIARSHRLKLTMAFDLCSECSNY